MFLKLDIQNMKAVVIGETPKLVDILKNHQQKDTPFSYENFEAFCQKSFTDENVHFWNQVQLFQGLRAGQKMNFERYQEEAKKIIVTFILDNATRQININHKDRNSLLQAWEKSQSDRSENWEIFDQVASHIFNLMESDIYPKYANEIIIKRELSMVKQEALWFLSKEKRTIKHFFSFQSPVNQADTRIHALCVPLVLALAIWLDFNYSFRYLYFYIVYGYVTRTLTGPKIDPQAWIVIFFLRPLFQKVFWGWPQNDFVAGPPRRFAQFVGAVFSILGTVFVYFRDEWSPSVPTWLGFLFWGILGVLQILLAITGFCAGCATFSLLMYMRLVPKEICEECHFSYVMKSKNEV